MGNGMRLGIVWAATAAVSMGGFAATALGAVDGHLQSHALRYAGMIESEEEPLMTVDCTNSTETSNTCVRDTDPDGGSEDGAEGVSDGRANEGQDTGPDHPDEAARAAGVGDGMHEGADYN